MFHNTNDSTQVLRPYSDCPGLNKLAKKTSYRPFDTLPLPSAVTNMQCGYLREVVLKSSPQDLTPNSIRGDIPTTEHLSGEQIKLIDGALTEVGESGVVRLVIEEGRLSRVVAQTQKRFDVLDYQPGMIHDVD